MNLTAQYNVAQYWMSNICSLYAVTNELTGHKYVGITARSVKRRWYEHVWNANHGEDTRFYRALRKYGAEAFEISTIVQSKTFEGIKEAEVAVIRQQRPEYNSTAGGDGLLGLVRTEQHRERLRQANLGRVVSAEARQNLSKALLGKPKSAEHAANISAGKKGKKTKPRAPTTDEARANMRAAALRREAQKREANRVGVL